MARPSSLTRKVGQLRDVLATAAVDDHVRLEVEVSPEHQYRYRCRFQLLPVRNDVSVKTASTPLPCPRVALAVWEQGAPRPIEPEDFTIACEQIQGLMRRVIAEANCGTDASAQATVLWQYCQAVHFHCTTTGEAMATLIYSIPLDAEQWTSAAIRLAQQWSCSILARSKGQKLVVGNDYVEDIFTLPPEQEEEIQEGEGAEEGRREEGGGGRGREGGRQEESGPEGGGLQGDRLQPYEPNSTKCHLTSDTLKEETADDNGRARAPEKRQPPLCIVLRQPEGAFSNPNPYILLRTMAWLRRRARAICADVSHMLELYAGAGTYTPILGHLFARVTTVEISTALANAAQYNARANAVDDNVRVLRAPVEAVRHIVASASHDGVSFDAVMLDPPRAGADAFTISCLNRYRHIILLSCNPLHTFPRDLAVLLRTHRIASAVALDHFPQTPHLEAALHLTRR